MADPVVYGDSSIEPPKKKKKKPDLPVVSIKNTADYQRMKLERLMANPDKPVIIPVRPKDKNLPPPPEFVRNVMGSSAGAGSGEFHVYRHLRRKEYARQKAINEKGKFEEMEDEYQRKLEENKKLAELKTAKKRAKRLKKKMKSKKSKQQKEGSGNGAVIKDSNSDGSSSDENDGEPSENGSQNSNGNGKPISPAGQRNGSTSTTTKNLTSNKLPPPATGNNADSDTSDSD